MNWKRDNVIRVDGWVDDYEPDADGRLRVRLARAAAPLTVGDVVCLGDGERVLFAEVQAIEGGVAVLKRSTGNDGAPAVPKVADDGWCDVLDE